MASKSLAMLDETLATPPQFVFDSASFNFSVQGRETSTGEAKAFSFNDSVNLNFNNDAELNRVLDEKAYLMEVVPLLVQKALQSYDSENEKAKQLKQALGALLQQ